MPRLFLLIAIAAAMASGFARVRALAFQRTAPGSVAGQGDAPPTDVQLRALIDRVLANQHADDDALPLFQRVERRQYRAHASDTKLSDDRTYRVIPIGTGTGWRVLVEKNGHSVPAPDYQAEILKVERALELVSDPANPKSKRDIEKYHRRLKDRADLLTAARDGFSFTWLGRETRGDRTLDKIRMAPNPNFKPSSRETELFAHVEATLWIDEVSAHVARVVAELTSDFTVGGGLVGKAYRGSRMTIEQAEVEPGVWLPSLYQYDYSWREFFSTTEVHEHTEASHYVRIGPPAEALAFIRRELSPSVGPRAQQ